MMRSILPSVARKSAADDKRYINKRRRARVRSDLHQVWDHESALEWDADWNHKDLDAAMTYVVWDRRGADKVGHFIRWAEAITSDIEDGPDKVAFMRQILPNTMIGRHAETHLPYDWKPRDGIHFPYARDGYASWGEYQRALRAERAKAFNDFYARIFSNRSEFNEFLDAWRDGVGNCHEKIVGWTEWEPHMGPREEFRSEPIHKNWRCRWCRWEPRFGGYAEFAECMNRGIEARRHGWLTFLSHYYQRCQP